MLTLPNPHAEQRREEIARIIEPKSWAWRDDHLARADEWALKGMSEDHALVGGYRRGADGVVANSLAKADSILALIDHLEADGGVEVRAPLIFYDSPDPARRMATLASLIEANPGQSLFSIVNAAELAKDLRALPVLGVGR
jgi:hypothetical protein